MISHSEIPLRLKLGDGSCTFKIGEKEFNHHLDVDLWNAQQDSLKSRFQFDELAIDMSVECSENITIKASLRNFSEQPVALKNIKLSLRKAMLGDGENGSYAFLKNGFQSWTASHVHFPDETQKVPNIAVSRVMQENMNNLADGRRGYFVSDGYAILGNLKEKAYLLMGQREPFNQMVYMRAYFKDGQDAPPAIEFVFDFGGKTIASGAELSLDPLMLMVDRNPNRLLDAYFSTIAPKSELPAELPTGWCSWYYYYTHVTQKDITDNIETAAGRGINWTYFVLDDGYQTAVGDWLSINDKFSGGLKNIADKARTAGFVPGIWTAPFFALAKSKLYQEHPDWFLQDSKGKPVWAGWNPLWSVFGSIHGLDTTNPGFQDYLRDVVHTIVHDFGFKYLKLDFLFGATLEGKAYDQSLSPAERLKLGFDIIREAAGPDIVILGCGCPLFPAIGKVQAMRIGPDVAPFWFAKYRYHITNDPHALCTKFAVRSIITRSQMHRMLWINDPDCLMLRDTDTRLTENERMTLANAIVITGGMYVISDKLSALPERTWSLMAAADEIVRKCDRGRSWALDIMEREFPAYVYNSAGYLAVFNMSDNVEKCNLRFSDYLEDSALANCSLEDVWTKERINASDGLLDFGKMPQRSSRLFKILAGE